MSHFLDRLNYFSNPREGFSGGHGVTTGEDRTWEDAYRNRWAHDKVVRSTHGVNCTGSCSWNVYVKDGLVTWETQAVDYPSTGPDMPAYDFVTERTSTIDHCGKDSDCTTRPDFTVHYHCRAELRGDALTVSHNPAKIENPDEGVPSGPPPDACKSLPTSGTHVLTF